MKMYRLPFFVTACLLLSISLFAQTNYYPGGLGNTNLKLWLNAGMSSSLTYNGLNQVSQWNDLSGNVYHFVQTTDGNKPVFSASAGPNNRPALGFTAASSQYLSMPLFPQSISYTGGVSTLSVINFTATGNYERIFDFGNNENSNNIIASRSAGSGNFFYEAWDGATGGQTFTTTTPIVNGTNNIFEAVQQGGATGTTSAVDFYNAGVSQTANGQLGSSITNVPPSIDRIMNFVGRSNWSGDSYYNGTMSEILFYNTAINTTQRAILQNYLSAAWGIAVTPSYFTPPTTSTFNKNLVGIGYTSIIDNVLSNPVGAANGSTDGLGFSSGTTGTDFLNISGFAMAAHDGQANTIRSGVTLSGIMPSGINLLNRSWFVHKSGGNSSGNINVNFNFSDYNSSSLPVGAVSYGLLYNASSSNYSTGTNVIITKIYATNAATVGFAVPASMLADGYYTLVWSTTTTLPVRLTSFTAQATSNAVNLEWKSDQEVNSDYFDIQRATDINDFVSIGRVKVVDKSSSTITYHFSDASPVNGYNNYRLKMVDLDGNSTLSNIRRLEFKSKADVFGFGIYPNPVEDFVGINCGSFNGTINIQILNNVGQSIFTKDKYINGPFSMSVNSLGKGVFFMKIKAGEQTVIKKFVKN